jgi:cobalt-zinc-cadmium efflux system membrane fusion protein
MKFLSYLLLMAGIVCACHSQQQNSETVAAVTIQGDTIQVSAESPILPRLKTETVRKEPYRAAFSTSGVVKAIPSQYAEIASPFAGRITQSFVRLGQKVAPGSAVFEVSSPSFYEAGKVYYQAKQEMELALKNMNREQDLLHNKVGVQKEADEAEVNYELKKKDFENAEAALKVFRVNPDKLTLGQPLLITSPIYGEVISDKIVIGQYLREDAEPVVIVANLHEVWVAARVKEKDLNMVQALDEVEIRLVAKPEQAITGRIHYISEMLDEETRSIEVLITCDNSARLMKPGMYGTVRLSDRVTDVVRIPTAAILQEETHCYVLVVLDGHRFLKREITAGTTDGDKTVILSGLATDEQIVSAGAYYLLDAR